MFGPAKIDFQTIPTSFVDVLKSEEEKMVVI